MFIKVTKSGTRRYVQLVEAYRDDSGLPKQRTIATLGRLDQLNSELESVIAGLLRLTGKSIPAATPTPLIAFESARDYGDVWTLTELWNALGFNHLRQVFHRTRHSIDVEALIRTMVINRLCDPESKLGILRWSETVVFPGTMPESITHQHLLRAMDTLVHHQDAVDHVLSDLLRPLVNQDLAVVFYDMTTIRTAGLSEQEQDIRKFGMSKEGMIARQIMLGVVQTAEGLPLYHEVFDGNIGEVTTLKSTIEKIIQRFPIKRVIAVADRGLLSMDNLAELTTMRVSGGEVLEFILAVPGRRYTDFVDLLSPLHAEKFSHAEQEVIGETTWDNLRLIVAHDPHVAKELGAKRDRVIQDLEQKSIAWVNQLEVQETGKKKRGGKLSDGGVRARFYRKVCEAHLTRIIHVDLKSELFTYTINDHALEHARLMDGKLLLVTNVRDFTPAEIVKRYKSLADIERGFRVLKSEIEIGPVHHRLPDRIRAHAAICFMALILYRIMRTRLYTSKEKISPERALSKLRRIQYHSVTLDNKKTVTGVSSINKEQADILSTLRIKKPILNTQLTIL
jgi:transposase